jgi:transposase
MGQEKMSQTVAPAGDVVTIGIDISKHHLDAHLLPARLGQRFGNNPDGIASLIRWASPHQPARVLFEATGAYHRGLETALAKAGLPAVKLNPWQARRFAEATGKRAKTDAVDAAMLARFGATLRPDLTPAREPAIDHLKALLSARRALIKDRTAARNRAKIRTLALLQAQGAERLREITGHIKAIDRACAATLKQTPALKARYAILTSIRGIGPVTAFALLADMPELGTLDAKRAASLAGLAPVVRASGTWQGKSSIQGGRKPPRDALYMPALVAIRFNPDMKAKYRAMIGAGKPAKVAIVAIMRKLLVLANALLRDGRAWTAAPIKAAP